MKKLLLGVLALVGMRVYADEITVHNTTDRHVTVRLALWNVSPFKRSAPLTFSINNIPTEPITIAAGGNANLNIPGSMVTSERWLFADYSSSAAETFIKLERYNRDELKKIESEKHTGIKIPALSSPKDFYIISDQNNVIRIQEDNPAVTKENFLQAAARTTQEVVTAVGSGVEGLMQRVITPAGKTGYQNPRLESEGIRSPILIINGFSNPIYVRMYVKSDVGLIAMNQEHPVEIKSNEYSFLQGPDKGSWFSRSPQATLLVAHQPTDQLKASTIVVNNPEGLTQFVVYNNEILNIAPNSVERFTIGRPIQIYNPEKTRADGAYGAMYVKNRGGGYILASQIVELKGTPGLTLPNIISAPNEQGFLARLGFGREKFLVGGARDTLKARLTDESLGKTPDANFPLKGTTYVAWNDPKLGFVLKTESGYLNRLSKVETWSLWIKNIFRKKATAKLLEELQEQ
jgi:hypothetical protein